MNKQAISFLFLTIFSNPLKAACSGYQGDIVINEYNYIVNFIELKILDSSAISNTSNFSAWTLTLFTKNGQNVNSTVKNLNSVYISSENSCGLASVYIDIPFSPNEMADAVNVVLADGSSQVVDVFRVSNDVAPSSYYGGYSACDISVLPYDTDAPQLVNSRHKDYSRIADGIGSWLIMPGTGANSEQSLCSSNDSGGGGGGDIAASSFNCVENGSDGIAGKLYSKMTAQSFSFDIIALQNASTIETSFASSADHSIAIELVNANTGDGSCANYSALTPSVSQNVTFIASDSGSKATATMSSRTAYSAVKCRMTDATSGSSIVGCSTDSFAIRPELLTITSNLTNTSSTGTPQAKAGEDLTLTATAAAGYDGIPLIDNSKLQAHVGATQNGSLSGVFNVANSGVATGSAFTYSEVGLFRFSAEGVYDENFTSVDQNGDCTDDFANTPDADGKIGCKFGNTVESDYFGRFTPSHFDVTLNTPVFSASNSTFSYIGQPVMYATIPVATLTAKNAAGVTTANYTGSYWKVNPTDASFGITPSYTEANHALMIIDDAAPVAIDNGGGSGTLSFSDTSSNILAITKSALTAPFDAEIALSFTLTDTDGVVVANVNDLAQINPVVCGAPSAGNGISFAGYKEQRWGRISLANAYGSELMPLTVPLVTEYYDGHNFIKNFADNSTAINLATQLSLNNGSTTKAGNQAITIGTTGSTTATLTNSPFSGGDARLELGAANAYGYVDLSLLNTDSWLLFDWDGSGVHDNLPTARGNFGLYKNNDKQIYFREVY